VQLQQILTFLNEKGVDFEFIGDESIEISQVSSLDKALSDEISFLTDKKYEHYLETPRLG